jgi:hypothetical protein
MLVRQEAIQFVMSKLFTFTGVRKNVFKSACDADDVNIQVRPVRELLLHPPPASRAGALLSCRKHL